MKKIILKKYLLFGYNYYEAQGGLENLICNTDDIAFVDTFITNLETGNEAIGPFDVLDFYNSDTLEFRRIKGV